MNTKPVKSEYQLKQEDILSNLRAIRRLLLLSFVVFILWTKGELPAVENSLNSALAVVWLAVGGAFHSVIHFLGL